MSIPPYIYKGLFLYLYLYVFHSDNEGKIHYPHFTLFVSILEIWKVGFSEGISNYSGREILVLWIFFPYFFFYTILFSHLLNGMVLKIQEQVFG